MLLGQKQEGMLLQEIYEIIENMTKKEKSFFMRYSKLYSGKAQERHYLHLYQEVANQVQTGALDEKKLIKQLKRKLDVKNLGNYKQYLHQQLLHFLVMYHKNLSSNTQITNMIQVALVLEQKGHRAMSKRLLKKASGQAEELENFEPWLFATHLLTNNPGTKEEFDVLVEEHHQILLKHQQHLTALELCRQAFNLRTDHDVLKKQDPRVIALQQELAVIDKQQVLSCKEQIMKLVAKGNIATVTFDCERMIELCMELEEIMDTNYTPFFSKKAVNYANVMKYACFLGDFDLYLTYEQKLKQVTVAEDYLSTFMFFKLQIIYCRTRVLKEEGAANVNQVKALFFSEEPTTRTILPSDRLRLIFDIISFQITVGLYEEAITWVSEWYAAYNKKQLYKRNIMIRIFEIIIHIELGNVLLLPSLISSLRRELKRHLEIDVFENLLFTFFRQSLAALNLEKDPLEVMKEFYQVYQNRDTSNEHPIWAYWLNFDYYFKNRLERLSKN